MKIINLKYYTALLLIMACVTSCQKVVTLDLGNHTGQLVIEGNITNVPGPQNVTLSRNVPFTNTNIYPAVGGATVSITDDQGHKYPLTESPQGTYSINPAIAVSGSSYTLSVLTEGTTYTARSVMPQVVNLDSISDKNSIFGGSEGKKVITVHFQDPPHVPNQYRFILSVNGVQVKSIFAFDDEFIDGKYVDLDLEQNDLDIYPEDNVSVEMQCLDRPVYTYWFTLSQQQVNNPGGAVAPANPPTNIIPTALGYFSAHTTQSITLVVK